MKKFNRGKTLESQAQQIVNNVYLYFLHEADAFKKEKDGYFQKVQNRVAEATGISRNTISKIVNKTDVNGSPAFSSPKKGRPRKSFHLKLDGFDYSVIRHMVYDFHLTFKELPTLKSLKTRLVEAIQFEGSIETLRQILKDIGFRFRRTENNRKILMEKHDVRLQRIKYLREIKKYRDAGKNIIFMNESYVHTSHTQGNASTDIKKKGLKQLISKGEGIFIVHAGNEKGFVTGALMMHKCLDSDGDCQREINADCYQNWLCQQLIPNIPPNSVLVMDNAPYYNKLVKLSVKPPNPNTPKPQMIAWLHQHNIPHDPRSLKPDLYSIIKHHKERFLEFVIDHIMQEHGHSILRLPPYHPDFNPIENIWLQIKGHVAKQNVAMNVTTVKELIQEKIAMTGPEDWKKVCDHAIKCEDEYRKFDNITDDFVINVGSTATSEASESERSDSAMSGIDMIKDSE